MLIYTCISVYLHIMFNIYIHKYHIVVISFLVFLFINFFENIVHYNIGKFSDKETKLEMPTKRDFIKIVLVMCIFALTQGLLTYYFNKHLK